MYRRDLVAEAHSELYQYDQMNQLASMERGVLNSDNTAIVSNTFEEDFTYDVTGNWTQYNRNGAIQTRTHNAANEILTISGGSTLVSHDRNGCMTKVPQPNSWSSAYTLVYDAWNRLIPVSDGDTLVATYMYDARNHQIKKTVGDMVTLSYFNRNWQEVESVTAGVTTTYVYGLRYIDDIVCRMKNTEVLYALQDPNWNVVALVNTSSAEGFQGDGISLHASPMPGTGVIYGRGIGTPIEPSKYPDYWNRDGSVLNIDMFCSFVTQSKACGNRGCTKDMCVSNINQLIQIAEETHSSTWLNQCHSWGNNFFENAKGGKEKPCYKPQACFSMSASWYDDMRWRGGTLG